MLLVTAVAAESTQSSPKLPNSVKICPKTISLRNFEIPPKIEILNLICRGCTKACDHRLDFQYNNFLYAFFIVKKRPLYVNFSIPLMENNFFLNVPHLL
jgi:hypothetical protein